MLIKTITHVTTNHSPLKKDANAKTSILKEQYNTWNKSTISCKLLKMDVLTFKTCWAVNSEIIKQVTSSWSISIQLESLEFNSQQEVKKFPAFYGTWRFIIVSTWVHGPGWHSQYSDLLQAGQSVERIPLGASFSTPVQTGPGAHPAS